MSEEQQDIIPQVTLVQHFGNIEGCVALFNQASTLPQKFAS